MTANVFSRVRLIPTATVLFAILLSAPTTLCAGRYDNEYPELNKKLNQTRTTDVVFQWICDKVEGVDKKREQAHQMAERAEKMRQEKTQQEKARQEQKRLDDLRNGVRETHERLDKLKQKVDQLNRNLSGNRDHAPLSPSDNGRQESRGQEFPRTGTRVP